MNTYIKDTQNENGGDDNFANVDFQQLPTYFRSHFVNQNSFFVHDFCIELNRFSKVLVVFHDDFFGRSFFCCMPNNF